jgi:hypothetical protein
MKKVLTFLLLSLMFISCNDINNIDDKLSTVIKVEIEHLKRYNNIQKLSKDTVVINYIIKVKDSLKISAIKSQGLIEGKTGLIFGDLKKPQEELKKYIKLCKN